MAEPRDGSGIADNCLVSKVQDGMQNIPSTRAFTLDVTPYCLLDTCPMFVGITESEVIVHAHT